MTAMTEAKAEAEAEIARVTAELASKAHRLEQRFEHMVDPHEQLQAHPWRFVGAAFAAGFVLGALS